MAIRKIKFVPGEFYHVFNRGVDKRIIFNDRQDILRFFQGMKEFNSTEPIGSIYENSFRIISLGSKASKLREKQDGNIKKIVRLVSYCLNPNHFHFLIEPLVSGGIEKFMQRLGTGYSKYFNNKYKRNGSLFQGKFKAVHVDSNEYLLHVSSYVNLNDRVHQLGSKASKLVGSLNSWGEYMGENKNGICEKGIILGQFRNASEYKEFALDSLKSIRARKEGLKEMENLLLE